MQRPLILLAISLGVGLACGSTAASVATQSPLNTATSDTQGLLDKLGIAFRPGAYLDTAAVATIGTSIGIPKILQNAENGDRDNRDGDLHRASIVQASAPLQPPIAATPASNSAESLRKQARFWYSENRDDLAEEALSKLFRIAPEDLQGLKILARVQVRRREEDGASKTLERMRRRYPDAPELADVEALLRVKGSDRTALQTIQQLAHEGHPDDAAAAMSKLYPKGPPSEELILDYWNFVAASKNGRSRARAGLQALVDIAPTNLRYRLALAELATSQPPVERHALAQIIALTKVPAYAKQARAAWRRAMLALDDSPGSIGLLRAYIDLEKNDSAVKARLDKMVVDASARRRLLADPYYQAQRSGIALLAAGKIEASQAPLERAYAGRKADVDLLNAMGLLRLRQRRHTESAALFSDAAKLDPAQRERWMKMVNVARYWGLIAQAETAADSKRPALAEEALLQAQTLDPRQTAAPLALASLYSAQQRSGDAKRLLEDVLRTAPGSADVIARLANLYLLDGQDAKLQVLLQDLSKAQQAALKPEIDKAQAARLRTEADRLIAAGRNDDAIAVLEQAAQRDLNDPWLRFDLAKLYAKRQGEGDVIRGDDLFNALLARTPKDPAALYAYALYQDNRERPDDALATLQQIRVMDRDPKIAQLQRRLSIGQKIRQAQMLFESGRTADARAVIDQAQEIAGDDATFTLQLAAALPDIGIDDAEVDRVLQKIALSAVTIPMATDDADRLSELQSDLLARRVRAMFAADDKQGAQRLLLQKTETAHENRRLQLLRAESALALDRLPEAESRYRRLLETNVADRDAALGLIDTLIAAGETTEARTLLGRQAGPLSVDDAASLASRLIDLKDDDAAQVLVNTALQTAPDSARLLGQAAQIAEHQNRPDQAIDYLQRSLAADARNRALRQISGGPPATRQLPTIEPANPAKELAENLVASGASSVPQAQPGLAVATTTASPGDSYQSRKLAELLDQRGTWLAGAIDTRSRSGLSGTSQYHYTEIPIELKRPWPDGGRVFAQAAIVKTSAGTLDLADSRKAADFGSVLLCQPTCTIGGKAQNASGIALAAGYERGGLRLDAGVTPLGFPIQHLVGGILQKGDLGPASYSVDVSRRALGGSVLSYAGARDPRTGELWGGVVATGVRFGLSRDSGGTFGAWSSLGLHRLTGRNVQENDRMQLMGGTYWRVINESDRLLTAGVNGMLWRFSENAGEYTFGHGGYYSPKRFTSIAFPLTYGKRTARFSYTVRAAISVSRSAAATADYFPTRPDFQSQADALSVGNGTDPHYTASTGRGVGRSLAAAFEYQLDTRLFMGGRLEIDRSTDYAPNRVMLYFRYSLNRDAARPVFLPPEALLPTSQY